MFLPCRRCDRRRLLANGAAKRRRIVSRNLRRATDGQLEGFALQRAVSDTFASYGRYWLELFRLPRDVWERSPRIPVEVEGFEGCERLFGLEEPARREPRL